MQYLTNITELAVSMKRLPQDVVAPFFKKLQELPQRTGLEQVGCYDFLAKQNGLAWPRCKGRPGRNEIDTFLYVL